MNHTLNVNDICLECSNYMLRSSDLYTHLNSLFALSLSLSLSRNVSSQAAQLDTLSSVQITCISISRLSMRYQLDLRRRSTELRILAIDRASVLGCY
jgi:hypothetical protein